jgi:hypothetical protein
MYQLCYATSLTEILTTLYVMCKIYHEGIDSRFRICLEKLSYTENQYLLFLGKP